MGLPSFYKFPGPVPVKILQGVCFVCWIVGGGLLGFSWYDMVMCFLTFPSGTMVTTAALLVHVCLHCFACVVPVGFILIHTQQKKIIPLAVYLVICAIGVVLAFVAFILVLEYREENKLREEYIELMSAEIKQTKTVPDHILTHIERDNCCSWFGPTDFGPSSLFDITDAVNTNKDMMEKVAICYGKTFKVSLASDGKLSYAPTPDSKNPPNIPTGCAQILVDQAYISANFTFCAALVAIILTLVTVSLFILNYLKLPSNQVVPYEQMQGRQSQMTTSDVQQESKNDNSGQQQQEEGDSSQNEPMF